MKPKQMNQTKPNWINVVKPFWVIPTQQRESNQKPLKLPDQPDLTKHFQSKPNIGEWKLFCIMVVDI